MRYYVQRRAEHPYVVEHGATNYWVACSNPDELGLALDQLEHFRQRLPRTTFRLVRRIEQGGEDLCEALVLDQWVEIDHAGADVAGANITAPVQESVYSEAMAYTYHLQVSTAGDIWADVDFWEGEEAISPQQAIDALYHYEKRYPHSYRLIRRPVPADQVLVRSTASPTERRTALNITWRPLTE